MSRGQLACLLFCCVFKFLLEPVILFLSVCLSVCLSVDDVEG